MRRRLDTKVPIYAQIPESPHQARELGVVAVTLEEALAVEVQRRAWLEENREAIEAYNEHIAQHGVFSTGLRGF